jgi:predicted SnoaL-like aldol condensation-catalyzing enzyme
MHTARTTSLVLLGFVTAFAVVLGPRPAGAAEPEATQADAHGRNANGALVASAMDALFVAKDTSAIPRYFAESFVDHDPLSAGPGLAGLEAGLSFLTRQPGFAYERVRVLADGDLVAVHGRYAGVAPQALVAFDVFRLDGGKIVEHWDALQPETKPNVSGRTELDGPTQIRHHGDTDANRTLVTEMVKTVFIGGSAESLSCFVSSTTYLQHNPDLGDGLSTLVDAIGGPTAKHVDFGYSNLVHVIADGDFVLAHAEGDAGNGQKNVFFDMWRAEDGMAVEHWDVVQTVPAR